MERALTVPHKRAPAEEILAAALRMTKALRPHRTVLASSRIDFARLDRLQVEAKRLKKEFAAAYVVRADRAAPTRRLPALFASAHQDVLILDTLMEGSDYATHLWRSVRRVTKRLGRPLEKRQPRAGAKRAA